MQQTTKQIFLLLLFSLVLFSCEEESNTHQDLLYNHEWECRDTIPATEDQPQFFTHQLLQFSENTFSYISHTKTINEKRTITNTVTGTFSYHFPRINFMGEGFNTYGLLNERELTITLNDAPPHGRVLIFQKKHP